MVTYAFLSLIVAFGYCFCKEIAVDTNVGTIKGIQEDIAVGGKMKTLSKFYGIPFGETTAGKNRFQKPLPKSPFSDTFSATEKPMACYQATKSSEETYKVVSNFTEDCLVLNIYVPHDFQSRPLLPVMVWVYGGGFVEGASGSYPADGLSAAGDVIVVTINYRIGPLGFLRSLDGKLAGNQGLWDQHLGIKWVHDNIGAFTGDPENITIFGESAGSASVLYQAIYPGNKGLFHRVIAESGTPLPYWALLEEPNMEKYVDLTSCAMNKSYSVECLRSLTPEEMQIDVSLIANESMTFRPIVDNDFLKGKPRDIILGNDERFSAERDFFASLDIVIGFNNYEGVLFLVYNQDLPDNFYTDQFNATKSLLDSVINFVITYMVKPKDDTEREIIYDLLEFTYNSWEDPDDGDTMRENMIAIPSDLAMFAPGLATAKAHSRLGVGRTYVYLFSAKPNVHVLPTPSWAEGSNHGDEIDYVFAFPLYGTGPKGNITYTEEERGLAGAVVSLWTNFARTGITNEPITNTNGYSREWWPQYTPDSQQYLDIGLTSATVRDRFHPKRMELWENLIPYVQNLGRPSGNQQVQQQPLSPSIVGK